jgi:hypothetical protein
MGIFYALVGVLGSIVWFLVLIVGLIIIYSHNRSPRGSRIEYVVLRAIKCGCCGTVGYDNGDDCLKCGKPLVRGHYVRKNRRV